LAREGSECSQGPKSTNKLYVNISIDRRNFVVAQKKDTYGEVKVYSTIPFLFVHFVLISTTSDQEGGRTLLKMLIAPACFFSLEITSPSGRQQPHK